MEAQKKHNEEKLPILGKLHKIMAEIDRIEKDAKNSHQGYEYASEKAIKEAMHPLLVKHGVIFQPYCEIPVRWDNQQVLPFGYTFWDIETGSCLSGSFVGSGQIRDDKGTYSSVTGAIKYILTSMFLIPTGDDPEKDETPKKSHPTKAPQASTATKADNAGVETKEQVIESIRKGQDELLGRGVSLKDMSKAQERYKCGVLDKAQLTNLLSYRDLYIKKELDRVFCKDNPEPDAPQSISEKDSALSVRCRAGEIKVRSLGYTREDLDNGKAELGIGALDAATPDQLSAYLAFLLDCAKNPKKK